MADHGVIIRNDVAAASVGSYNRYAISGSKSGSGLDLDNGNVFNLVSQSTTTGYDAVWSVTMPMASGSVSGLWMACSQRANLTVDGTLIYSGLNDDPRKFYNVGGRVLDAFKPQVGDVITLSTDCFLNAISSNLYANAITNSYLLDWEAVPPASGALSFKWLATTYISVGTGAFDTQRVTAYKLVCVAN
jgi:hypothetical protein